MNEAFFPVQNSLLSELALAQWLSTHYALPTTTSCRFWSRSINDTYLIQGGKTTFFLRITPTGWRSYEQIDAEIELLHFLRQHNFAVPEPIPQKNGAYIQTFDAPEGPRYAVAFSFAPGQSPAPMTPGYSYHYGQAIAQLHTLTDMYFQTHAYPQFDLENMLDKPLVLLKPIFTEHEDDWAYLHEISNELRVAVTHLPQTSPFYGICHGDVNDTNIHFDDHNKWTLIDFEHAGYGWRVFDISNFILAQVNQGGTPEAINAIRTAFLEGYQSIRSLSESELAALPAFVLLRQIWMLGVAARLAPNLGQASVQRWFFDSSLPFIKAWSRDPW